MTGQRLQIFSFYIFSLAIEKIKKYLSFNKVNPAYPKIETFQLQIICEYIELNLVKDKNNFTVNDLPDLSEITQDYYKNIFDRTDNKTNQKIFNDLDKLLIRFLIERKLIDKKTGNRICLDKIFVTVIGFDDALLDKLIETRIIRREPNTVSGQSIELSHDTLVEPIIKSSSDGELGNLDAQLTTYYTKTIKKLSKTYKTDIKNLEKKLVTEEEGTNDFKEKDLSNNELEIVNELAESKIILKDKDDKNNNVYILNEAFQDVVIKKLKSLGKLTTLIKYLSTIAAALLIIGVIANFAYQYHKQLYREKAFTVALLINTNDPVDSLKKLLALNEAYKQFLDSNLNKIDSTHKSIIVGKLIDCFNYNLFLAKKWNKVNSTVSNIKLSITQDSVLVLYTNTNAQAQAEGYIIPGGTTTIIAGNATTTVNPVSTYYILYDSKNHSILDTGTVNDADFDYSLPSHIKKESSYKTQEEYADSSSKMLPSEVTDTAKNKTNILSYKVNSSNIYINSKNIKQRDYYRGEGLKKAYFSTTGDTVFVITQRGNLFLFNIDNSILKLLSKFYIGSNSPFYIDGTNGLPPPKIKNIIPVIYDNSLYFFNLRKLPSINTIDPEQISDWISEKRKHKMNGHLLRRIKTPLG